MTAVLLALGAAISYGLSDFLGGFLGKRASPWSVAVTAGLAGGAFLGLAATLSPGTATTTDLGWGTVAGVGNGLGTAFLYRGLAGGRMGVVSPVSGVTAAVLPVCVGLLSGERPTALVWLGILVALPAIWLVAREPSGPSGGPTPGAASSGVADGLLAGLGFGVLFAALAQIPDGASLWPLTLTQVVGVLVVVLVASGLHQEWLPTTRPWSGALPGILGAAATLAFLVSTRHGLLTVTAVLASLYPAGTVLLAAVVLREHVHRTQALGLAMCAITVACVAAG